MRFTRRVAVVVHTRLKQRAVCVLRHTLRQPGKRHIPAAPWYLRCLVQVDRDVFLAQNLLCALFVVKTAEPYLRPVWKCGEPIALTDWRR